MKDKTTIASRFHKMIKTKHVFLENDQVFLKKEDQESPMTDQHGDIWMPVNFQWIPIS